jgi:hypothetical protein
MISHVDIIFRVGVQPERLRGNGYTLEVETANNSYFCDIGCGVDAMQIVSRLRDCLSQEKRSSLDGVIEQIRLRKQNRDTEWEQKQD